MLEENTMLFERGEDGNLIAEEVILELLENKPTVMIRPLSRGQLRTIYSKATSGSQEEKLRSDNEIILLGLVKPVMDEKKLQDIKPSYANAIAIAILAVSLDVTQEKMSEKAETVIENNELELKKK